MRPDDQQKHAQPIVIPSRQMVNTPPRTKTDSNSHISGGSVSQPTPAETNNEPTANVMRSMIDQIYENDPHANIPTEQPTPEETSPLQSNPVQTSPDANLRGDAYAKVHDESHLRTHENQWKEYHSAWQNYYQQYFYRYYAGHIMQKDAELEAIKAKSSQAITDPSGVQGTMSESEAVDSLRSQLRTRIAESAKKARKSRHFAPIAAAIGVMLVFLGLQYNTMIVGAFAQFVSPGNVTPDNIIVDEKLDVPVGPESKLIIPKINVDEPIIWDTKNDPKSQLKAMEEGIAYFGIPGANSKPGQVGNTVLSAHSTNNILETGDHKFVFLHLPSLKKGDLVYINYKSTRYTYKVTKTEEVMPNNVKALVYETSNPVITLITCVPIGTADRRLLVTAEQISPNPNDAKAAPATTPSTEPEEITGNSPSLLERLFGG